jgi:hypothetical protein
MCVIPRRDILRSNSLVFSWSHTIRDTIRGRDNFFLLVCNHELRVSHFTADSQSVSMSWCRAHIVDNWPDIASFSRVWVWNFLSCLLWGTLSDERLGLSFARVRVTLRLTVSQYVLVSSSLCGRMTRYCFLFKSLGLEFFVLSLWGVLSEERSGLSFVRVTLRLTVSQYVLVSSPLCGCLTRYCFLVKSLSLEFVVLSSVERSLWREAGSVLCKSEV